MSNTFNTGSLHQQHNVATTSLLQSPPSGATIGNYLQQQSTIQQQLNQLSLQQQQQLAAVAALGNAHNVTTTTTATICDPRQLQAASGMEKAFYAGTSSISGNTAGSGRIFTSTSNSTLPETHPNTILITNNFAQSQLTAPPHPQRATISGVAATAPNYNNNNIRIMSASPSTHHQHVFSINSKEPHQLLTRDTLQHSHLYHQQLLQQQTQPHFATHQQQAHIPTVMPQHSAQLATGFTHQPFQSQSQSHPHAIQHIPSQQQFYVSTEAPNSKIITTMATSVAADPNEHAVAQPQTTPQTNASTVVLDRINICINNHYTDATTPANAALTTSAAQQPSPIIPAITHKPVVDIGSTIVIEPYGCGDSPHTTLVIDEPDSTTTTPHTPPTTPENSSPSPTNHIESPIKTIPNIIKQSFVTIANLKQEQQECGEDDEDIEEEEEEEDELTITETIHILNTKSVQNAEITNNSVASPDSGHEFEHQTAPSTPPTQSTAPPPPLHSMLDAPNVIFEIGEDVFINRQDGRFYLGTIIEYRLSKFLIRFDDKTEVWCMTSEMRKLGGGGGTTSTQGQMCVACKRTQNDDIVEICERCGRGYHRKCTMETSPGSGIWLCKRCTKPMMVSEHKNFNRDKTLKHHLPTHSDSLKWDDKPDEDQVYCYCAQIGKFSEDMLQCCKCKNWFHPLCVQQFRSKVMHGDRFFVFCCSICNNGKEFLRRLQMNWVDLVHLTLYNMSLMKRHQYQKNHHLLKDICPFLLTNRATLSIPKEWIKIPENELKEKIKSTLREYTDRFTSGREIKQDRLYFGLRNNDPPLPPLYTVLRTDVLTDEFVVKTLKLNLLKGAPENETLATIYAADDGKIRNHHASKPKETMKPKDVYEFEDDEKFTSDDEIPIKQILEKVKNKSTFNIDKVVKPLKAKKSTTTLEDFEIDDENANDGNCNIQKNKNTQKNDTRLTQKNVGNAVASKSTSATTDCNVINATFVEKSSRKRKAFTLSKSYKEIAAEAAAKRYDSNRICDSSSDENSSSSRGTSLDVIIPAPKNFLGPNNPFRMVTPKKNSINDTSRHAASFVRSGIIVKNSIVNTSALDFSMKIAALKSAGIFTNLSTSNLAKAAGQPRTVRTIKRRLSAKDITIGPNQEVRRRRTRRLSSNIEVISTTTINPLPTSFFPIHAKDLLQSTMNSTNNKLNQYMQQPQLSSASSSSLASSLDLLPSSQIESGGQQPTHGRRLRQRPQKTSPSNSRRNSLSSASSASNQSNSSIIQQPTNSSSNSLTNDTITQDLKHTVNQYFGAVNRIESGEQYCIRAKRITASGQHQHLIEWGDAVNTSATFP